MRHEISNSELGCFRTCRKRWGFEYLDLLRPKVAAKVLRWGNTIHAGLEAGYRGALTPGVPLDIRKTAAIGGADLGVRNYHSKYLEHLDQVVQEGVLKGEYAQERYDDAAQLLDVALYAVAHFFDVTNEDLGKLIPLAFEVPFRVPVPDKRGRPHVLLSKGKIDGVWWDPEGESIIVDDHKTTMDLVGTVEKRIALDPQMSGYLNAVRHLIRTGKLKPLDGSELPEGAADRVGRSRYNVIRRSMPKYPGINKVQKNKKSPEHILRLAEREAETGTPQGLVSTAACDTTAAIYETELVAQVERGLEVTDKQHEIVQRLRGQGDRYFARFEFWRNADEMEQWRSEMWVEARLMREAEKDRRLLTRNPGACTQANSMPCAFRAVCMDNEPETRALYRVAEMKHEEVGL